MWESTDACAPSCLRAFVRRRLSLHLDPACPAVALVAQAFCATLDAVSPVQCVQCVQCVQYVQCVQSALRARELLHTRSNACRNLRPTCILLGTAEPMTQPLGSMRRGLDRSCTGNAAPPLWASRHLAAAASFALLPLICGVLLGAPAHPITFRTYVVSIINVQQNLSARPLIISTVHIASRSVARHAPSATEPPRSRWPQEELCTLLLQSKLSDVPRHCFG